jgi:hypothetical protein
MTNLGQTYDTEEEAIAAAKANAKDCMIDFDGQNCADSWDEGANCMGWDGESHRCDCGNRRVYWETSRNSEGKFYAYAMAY